VETETAKPPRPSGNTWRARLWDSLYNKENLSQNCMGNESILKQEINDLVHKGESLRKLLERVEDLVGEDSGGDEEILLIAHSEYKKEMLFREEIDFTPCVFRRNTLQESFRARPPKRNYNWRRTKKVDPNRNTDMAQKNKYTVDGHMIYPHQRRRGYSMKSPSFTWVKKLMGR